MCVWMTTTAVWSNSSRSAASRFQNSSGGRSGQRRGGRPTSSRSTSTRSWRRSRGSTPHRQRRRSAAGSIRRTGERWRNSSGPRSGGAPDPGGYNVFVALADGEDDLHARAISDLKQLGRGPFGSTVPVLSESFYLL